MKSRRWSLRICVADKEQNSLAQRSRRTQRFPTQTPSMQCPKRKRVADVELGIQVIKEIQPAILQRTAVGFNLSKSESIKRSPVFRTDLDNHLKALIVRLFDRDHFCRKRGHLRRHFILPAGREQGLLFGSQNCVLRRFCHPEFNDSLGRNPDLLSCLRVDSGASFPLDRITLHPGEGLVRISAL